MAELSTKSLGVGGRDARDRGDGRDGTAAARLLFRCRNAASSTARASRPPQRLTVCRDIARRCGGAGEIAAASFPRRGSQPSTAISIDVAVELRASPQERILCRKIPGSAATLEFPPRDRTVYRDFPIFTATLLSSPQSAEIHRDVLASAARSRDLPRHWEVCRKIVFSTATLFGLPQPAAIHRDFELSTATCGAMMLLTQFRRKLETG